MSRLDRYVFSCDSQRCIGEFRVAEVAAFGMCERRPVVKNIDPQVADFLVPLIGSPGSGIYIISLRTRYWPQDIDGEGVVALLDSLEGYGGADLRSRSAAELRREFEDRFGVEWLRKDDTHKSVFDAKHAWETMAWRAQMLLVSIWGAYWFSFVVAIAWLVQSIHVFFFRLYQAPAQGLRRFAYPCLAQIIIGLTCVSAQVLDASNFWLGTLLVPVVVVVLLAEGWAFLLQWRSK